MSCAIKSETDKSIKFSECARFNEKNFKIEMLLLSLHCCKYNSEWRRLWLTAWVKAPGTRKSVINWIWFVPGLGTARKGLIQWAVGIRCKTLILYKLKIDFPPCRLFLGRLVYSLRLSHRWNSSFQLITELLYTCGRMVLMACFKNCKFVSQSSLEPLFSGFASYILTCLS